MRALKRRRFGTPSLWRRHVARAPRPVRSSGGNCRV